MNHKTFSLLFIAFFVLNFCLSSATSRKLSGVGVGDNKGEMKGRNSRVPSTNGQQLLSEKSEEPISRRALKKPPVCNEKIYGNCIPKKPCRNHINC